MIPACEAPNAEVLEQLREVRRKAIKIVMLAVFGDESHDEKTERVFAVAGLIGHQQEWDDFEIEWKQITRGKIFHGVDCESGHGDYAGIDHATNQREYADLAKFLARSKLVGHAAIVSLEEYRRAFPSDLPGEPYFWCFLDVIKELGAVGYFSLPQEQVKFTFDITHEHEYNAGFLYDWIVRKSESKLRPFLADEIAFACRKTVGIQAADLCAREGMKDLDNQIGPTRRLTRLSIDTLRKNRALCFKYFRTRDDFDQIKKRSANLLVHSESITEYRRWLASLKLDDSLTNRIRYLRK